MDAYHVIVMLVFATCMWTTVHCSEGECVICDHCEEENASSYENKKCPEVEFGINVCVTEIYESGQVLRRCLRPGEKQEVSCRDSVDTATSEKVQICSCEPGSCDLGRWGITHWTPSWKRTTEWPPAHEMHLENPLKTWFEKSWKIIVGVFVGVFALIIILVTVGCVCTVNRQKRRRQQNMAYPIANNATGYPTSDAYADNTLYPNLNSAPGYPTGAAGYPTGAAANPPRNPTWYGGS